jgi:hypothetical protein
VGLTKRLAAIRPTPMPKSAGSAILAQAVVTMSCISAPRAIRIPNSGVRRLSRSTGLSGVGSSGASRRSSYSGCNPPPDLFSDLFAPAVDYLAPEPTPDVLEEARNNPSIARQFFSLSMAQRQLGHRLRPKRAPRLAISLSLMPFAFTFLCETFLHVLLN